MTLSCPGYVRETHGKLLDQNLSLPSIGRAASSEAETPATKHAEHKNSNLTSSRGKRGPYTMLFVKESSSGVGSHYSKNAVREPGESDKFRHWIARNFAASASKTDPKRATSLSSNAAAQVPTRTGKIRSLALSFVKDIPKEGAGVSKQGRHVPIQSVDVAKQGTVISNRGTDMVKRGTVKEDALWCRYCGQSSRIVDFMERALIFKKPADRGVRPNRALVPVRCKTCFSFFPMSPQARSKTEPDPPKQEPPSRGGKVRILKSKSKPSVLTRAFKAMSEESRAKEDQDENKKKERASLQAVDRDVLLLRLHIRALALNPPDHKLFKDGCKGAEESNPVQSPSKSLREESNRTAESERKNKCVEY